MRHEMMMSKTETMPLMMAVRIPPMPLTIAMRHAPMDWNTDLIQDTTAPILTVIVDYLGFKG